MGRPKKTKHQYYREYFRVIYAISKGIPLRTVSKNYAVGLSTCMRLKKLFLWGKSDFF